MKIHHAEEHRVLAGKKFDHTYVVHIEPDSNDLAKLRRVTSAQTYIEAFYIAGSVNSLPANDVSYTTDARKNAPHVITFYPKACEALGLTSGPKAAEWVRKKIDDYLRSH